MHKSLALAVVSICYALLPALGVQAQPVVPGTGYKVAQVGDDFEDPSWSFVQNLPKSSEEQDEQQRLPTGYSVNGRWYEGIKRGHPDVMKYVPTPEGGLEGSRGSLLIQTLRSGIPGTHTFRMQQDDLIANCHQRLGGSIPVSQTPNCVVRVFLPPFDQWENRSGPTFGFRVSLDTHTWKVPDDRKQWSLLPPTRQYLRDVYWPGMFIELAGATDRGRGNRSASFRLRGDRRGADFRGPQITTTGWWTLGISVTPDGQVHYYASPGVDALTEEDYVASQYPYGYRAERFRTFFFNVCNRDDGRTWSTPWIVDDPTLYFIPPGERLANKG